MLHIGRIDCQYTIRNTHHSKFRKTQKTAHVKAAQLVQERPGYLTVKIVPEPEFKQEDAAHILSELYDRAGKDNLIITMEKTDINGLIYSQSGKYRYIVNLID